MELEAPTHCEGANRSSNLGGPSAHCLEGFPHYLYSAVVEAGPDQPGKLLVHTPRRMILACGGLGGRSGTEHYLGATSHGLSAPSMSLASSHEHLDGQGTQLTHHEKVEIDTSLSVIERRKQR